MWFVCSKSNVSFIDVPPLFGSRCLVANFVKYRPLFPSKCLRLGVIDPKQTSVFSYWDFTLLFILYCHVYFFIIYFLLCICNSPLSSNYFGKLQLFLIKSLNLALPLNLFSHFFMHLLPHSSFIIFYLFISLLLYFNPYLVLHFSFNFSKFFSF